MYLTNLSFVFDLEKDHLFLGLLYRDLKNW